MADAFDIVVVAATPGGIMAAVAAARLGKNVALLERTAHIGGLPANGLGATDIATRGATGGLFKEFVGRVKAHYVKTYGATSNQVKDCSDGYHFEPSVAEKVFEAMVAEQPTITLRRGRQFDAKKENVTKMGDGVTAIRVTDLQGGQHEEYTARVFIDATYEGDLAAAAGAPFETRRESSAEYNEPLAGRVYKRWGGGIGEGTTFEGDDVIQAYNFRLCLTDRPENRLPIKRPENYNREEFVSLIADVKGNRTTGDVVPQGIARLVNMVKLPNAKTDSNNQHFAFISTDLPEENYPWPTADWAWRDRFAVRLKQYTLGLLYFAQNDPELPEEFRKACRVWGLAKDEYTDNDGFPRQVYVREGRRIVGEHKFVAHDALPRERGGRPPIRADSITASHYALDSHAVRKREPERVHLDGFLSKPTAPYTVPLGVIVPRIVENLLTPVPVSGTHIGFSTLRMEPCWMALGQAAGVAAALSIDQGVPVRRVNQVRLQKELLKQKAILIYYRDLPDDHPHFAAIQFFGVRGFLPEWEAHADHAVTDKEADAWVRAAGANPALAARIEGMSRAAFLDELYRGWA